MRKIIVSVGALFLFLSFGVHAMTPVAQLDELLSTFKSMSANFQQTAIVKNNAVKKSSGKMALQRPGKFRWEITSPNHQIILADGKYLWIYDVDLEQATKQSLTKDAHSPAILLSGSTTALEQRFNIIERKEQGPNSLFMLKPKNNKDMIDLIELRFVNQKLSQMSVVDNLGQKNIFYFSNVVINPTLPSSLFQFSAPKGVDIIQN